MRSKGFLLNSGKVHSEIQARWLRLTSSSKTNYTAIFPNIYSQHYCTNKSSWSTSNWMYIFHVFEMVLVSFHTFFTLWTQASCEYETLYWKYWVELFFGLTKQTPALWVGGNGFISYHPTKALGCHDGKHRENCLSVAKGLLQRGCLSLCVCGYCDTKKGGKPKAKDQNGSWESLVSSLASSSVSHRTNPQPLITAVLLPLSKDSYSGDLWSALRYQHGK